MKGVVIAGTASGVGKTTITCGLIGALRARGLAVAPFKVGPDYIDPSYHARAAGRPCHTLDSWMVPHDALRQIFERATRDADIAVIEGVMGLFDGRSGGGEAGSTAEVAKLLGLPVILVVDAAKTARSVAAQVLGFQRFDPDLRVTGVILNNVASPNHASLCTEPIEAATGLPVLGALQRTDALRVPERYLGLVPTVEGRVADQFFADAIERVSSQVDLTQLLRLAGESSARDASGDTSPWPAAALGERVTIAVAHDEAFSFMYPENLDLLTSWGAVIAPFSPLHDRTLPAGTAGVYLGGGFPELYAQGLSANMPMLASLRVAAARGLPIYGECGGLMYLGQQLTDNEGAVHAMAGIVPLRSSMAERRLTLGYRMATAQADGPHLTRGQTVRGHEFHWSTLEESPEPKQSAYATDRMRHEGYARGNVWASYVHLHFATDAHIAPRFIAQCEAAAAGG
ncbi:MAG: hydrogenobyrinate a,c-diamide synthase [Chloroflexota bacterium]|nr:MAG: cobyrinate a,c-diamide synthase [Dehalococcoidia bacterium]